MAEKKGFAELKKALKDCPAVGGVWVHYKTGERYRVVCAALEEATLTPVVVYRSEASGVTFTRPLAAWEEDVGDHDSGLVVRFRRVAPGFWRTLRAYLANEEP